ncbi:DoxX family protein [Paenibacillus thalictri]|uniref:DoxX family membrane protein n=1 Tax=Paenibacillus thalictri TaxID=2527873 RepID=A0A4Q9DWK5_9BACL|nr:DoxX family protein [Paenibacillus thalictri]TBL80735.1 hypothetical protein EYB31_05785 [Paenibacillus thalictri]
MAPLYALVFAFIVFRLSGSLGLGYMDSWHTSLQAAAAVMLLLTASAHWGKRRPDLINMVPPSLPRPDLIVTLTGLLEIAGAIGLLLPATSRVSSVCLILLLIAMFPANIRAAKKGLTIAGKRTPKLLVRTLLQAVFITAILLAG